MLENFKNILNDKLKNDKVLLIQEDKDNYINDLISKKNKDFIINCKSIYNKFRQLFEKNKSYEYTLIPSIDNDDILNNFNNDFNSDFNERSKLSNEVIFGEFVSAEFKNNEIDNFNKVNEIVFQIINDNKLNNIILFNLVNNKNVLHLIGKNDIISTPINVCFYEKLFKLNNKKLLYEFINQYVYNTQINKLINNFNAHHNLFNKLFNYFNILKPPNNHKLLKQLNYFNILKPHNNHKLLKQFNYFNILKPLNYYIIK